MKAIRDLSAEEALLLLVGVSALAWMAVPDRSFLPNPSETGAIAGEVVDLDGEAGVDVPVGLFHAGSLDLVELTHTDVLGRFAFHQVPSAFHVLALPADHDRGPGWLLDLQGGRDFELVVVLGDASSVEVLIHDAEGRPIAGAEVRAYQDGSGGVVPTALADRVRTDGRGRAALRIPGRCVLGAFATGFSPAWSIPGAVSEGVPIRIELPAAP